MEELEAGSGSGPAESSPDARVQLEHLVDPVRSLEQEAEHDRLELEAVSAKKGKCGGGLAIKPVGKSVVESKIVVNLAPLSGDGSLFRQRGGKLSNAPAHLSKGHARALDNMKGDLEQGHGPEEELAPGVGATEHEVDMGNCPRAPVSY